MAKMQMYTVTITPAIITYAGGGYGRGQTFGEYTVEKYAKSRADAIKHGPTWGWVVFAVDAEGNQLWDAQYFANRASLAAGMKA